MLSIIWRSVSAAPREDPDVARAALRAAFARLRVLLELVREEDDRVERRAQLVGDGREEVRLQAVELLELAVSLGPLAADAALVADRPPDADERPRAGPQLVGLDRLADEIVRARVESPLAVDRPCRSRAGSARTPGRRVRDPFREVVPESAPSMTSMTARSYGSSSSIRAAAAAALVDDRHLVTVGREILPDELRDLRLVVDDEHPARARSGAARRPPGPGPTRSRRTSRNESTRDANVSSLMGLGMKPSQPAASARSRSPCIAWAVTARIGICVAGRVGPDLARRLPAREQRQRQVHEDEVGLAARVRPRPRPVRRSPHEISWPSASSSIWMRARMSGESSAIRMRAMVAVLLRRRQPGVRAPTEWRTSRTRRAMSAPLRRMRWAEPFRRA